MLNRKVPLERKKGTSLNGYAKLADGTGFSSPSVDILWSEWRVTHQQNKNTWTPEELFPNNNEPSPILTQIIETLKTIPEIHLGTEVQGEFNAERIARITDAWVNGTPLIQLAEREYKGDLLKCTHHIYGTVTSSIPWGLRAIEKIAFAGEKEISWDQLDLLPAMIYHGVKSKEAIALRMLNVPRLVAEGLANQWRKTVDISLSKASDWLKNTSNKEWNEAIPPNSPITGEECKRLWEVLEGERSWEEIF